MDDQEIDAFLGPEKAPEPDIQFGPRAAAQAAALPTVAPTPQGPSIAGKLSPKAAEEQFRQENVAPGVPLDIESGVSPWESLMLDVRKNRENQIKYLENKYGPNTVRLSSDGELIVRMPDPENKGQVKDLLVRPHTMKATDFIDLLATVPEVAASIYAMRKGEMIPWLGQMKTSVPGQYVTRGGALGLARQAATAAAGGEAAGAVKDIAANIYDVGTPQLGQVAAERAERIPGMTAIGMVGGAIPSLWKYAKNPLAGGRTQLQLDAIEAQKYFKDKFGIDVPLSVGQSTGSPLFGRSEVYIEKLPGGSGPVRELSKQTESALRRLQSVMLGTSLPTEEELGTRAMAELQPAVKTVTGATEIARKELGETAQNAIEQRIGSLTAPAKELYHEQTGAAIRQAVVAKRDAAKAEADRLYGLVRSLPGGEGKVFEGGSLQADFKQILKDLPAPQQRVEVPTGLVDQLGRPITTTATKTETLREFVPPNVLQRLQSVVNLKDAKFSLSDLQQMRREVYDDIAKGEGVPGLGTHYLADIGGALTKAIDDGVSALPSGDLKRALQAANAHYKNNVIPFNRVGLTELFRAPNEAGFVSNSEVLNRMFSGGKATQNWNLVKETIGQGSPEFQRMRRGVADMILENSRIPGEETLDAKSFVRNLYNFRREYRSISDDVFSKQELELFRQARFLKYAQGDKLNEQALRDLLASPNPSSTKLQALINAEKRQDTLYKNSILKSIGDGTFSEETLKPSEFLNRMIDNKGVGPEQIKQVMDKIQNPTLLEDIRRKTYEKLFRDASRNATANDVNLIMRKDPTHILSGTRIAASLKDTEFRNKLETILGGAAFKDLDQFVKLSAATELPEQSFRSAGGIAAGTQVAKAERILETGGLLAYAGNVARSFLFSYVLSNPATRAWLTNVPSDPSTVTAFLHTLASSPPFLEAVSREFPKAAGLQFIHNLKASIDRSVGAQSQPQRRAPNTGIRPIEGDIDKFLGPEKPNAAVQGMVPAIRTMTGRIIRGKPGQSHNDVIDENRIAATNIDRRIFVDAQGREVSREQLGRVIPTQFQPGRAHSSDLNRAQENE